MSTTRVTRHIDAPRSAVYRALLDREAVQQWMVPDGMTSRVHLFEPREGGRFRISLTYDAPMDSGKTDAQTDTFHGRFVRLVRDEEVVQVVEFEANDPGLQGEMTITYVLAEASGGGTDLIGLHEDLPAGVRPEDNELGWSISIGKLARLVETPG
ncbi:MAG TPA: SRPBCC domain-containing protein [Acidimicrobiales bacterium]|nr:SRPBCC domain-containing protein [Acidimicrobiales bacterium]